MPGKPPPFSIHDHTRTDFGFLQVDRFTVRYRRADGETSLPQPRINIHRGDAVAGLLHHVRDDGHWLYLVNQFRLSTAADPDTGAPTTKGAPLAPIGPGPRHVETAPVDAGWIVELMAGMRMKGEPWGETLRRECREETGFDIVPSSLEFIGSFYPSPGACSERIHLYYAKVDAPGDARPSPSAKGVDDEEVVLVPLLANEFLAAIEDNEIHDAKAIAAAEWMRREANRKKHFSGPLPGAIDSKAED